MAHKKGNALCRHLTFYPAAAQGFAQVKQILHDHWFCKIHRIHIRIIHKNKTKFCKVITNGERTVMANG